MSARRALSSEAKPRQPDVEIIRLHLMSSVVKAERHASANATGDKGTGEVGDNDILHVSLASGSFAGDGNALERVSLMKPAPHRPSGERERFVLPPMEMDHRRQVRNAILGLRDRLPENAREGHGTGKTVSGPAQAVPRHGCALREPTGQRVGTVEAEALFEVVENVSDEGGFVSKAPGRIRMRPGSLKPVHRDEGQSVPMRGADQRPMAHLQFRGAPMAMEEDIGAPRLALPGSISAPRQFDPIGAAFDRACDGASAGAGAGGDRKKAECGECGRGGDAHALISIGVTATDIALSVRRHKFTSVHVAAEGN